MYVLSQCAEPVRNQPNKLQRLRHPKAPPKMQWLITLGVPPAATLSSLLYVPGSCFMKLEQRNIPSCDSPLLSGLHFTHTHQSERCIMRQFSISSLTESPTDRKVTVESQIVPTGLIIAASEDGQHRPDAAPYWTIPSD